MLFLIIGSSISILLLFFPDINNGYIGSFLKGGLTVMMFIAIISIKQIRHIYNNEKYILKILKKSNGK